MLARFPRGLFLTSRPLFSLRISVGHLGSGVRDSLREKGSGDVRDEKSEQSGKCGQSSRDGSRPHRRHLEFNLSLYICRPEFFMPHFSRGGNKQPNKTRLCSSDFSTYSDVAFSGQKRSSGAEVEIRVIRGQNVTLLCDCEIHRGSNIAWFRNCSHSYQPTLKLPPEPSRYSLKWNDTDKTHHLEITAITESDQGVYYCARDTDDIYYYGNKTTRLSVIVTASGFTAPVTEALDGGPVGSGYITHITPWTGGEDLEGKRTLMPVLPSSCFLWSLIWEIDKQIEAANPHPQCPPSRLYTPPKLRDSLITWTHASMGTGHPGSTRTAQLLGACFWWPALNKDAAKRGVLLPQFGLTEDIVSDRGSQFSLQVWKELLGKLNITVGLMSGYHPKANGQWCQCNERVWEETHQHLCKAVPAYTREADRRRGETPQYEMGQKVWVATKDSRAGPTGKLVVKYAGPYAITGRVNNVTYKVGLPGSSQASRAFHVSALKLVAEGPLVEESGVSEPPSPPLETEGGPAYRVQTLLDSPSPVGESSECEWRVVPSVTLVHSPNGLREEAPPLPCVSLQGEKAFP
ncbi:hypothetical protein P4O66_001843 [Electrophorus voltai]|uniref:Gypsy retrotransposon integrase-like protein 1 n=1 Tax=Electrophorus voltai TaxID=2609070 RepID=A0AAD8Z3Z5_9TELE|nr:hypothetical protein P4O66_001843 [Electrophorus voltai]